MNWTKELGSRLFMSYNYLTWFKFLSVSSYFVFNFFWNSVDEYTLENDLNPPTFTENSVDVLLAQQPAVQAGRFEFTHFNSDLEYEQALVNAIWWSRWKTYFSHRSSMQHRALIVALNKQRLIKFQGLLRRQPFGVLIHGGPGTGKSKAAYEIAKRLKESEGDPLTANQLIVLNEADEFQSEYRSCHKVVVFDDVGTTKLSVESKDSYRKVIDFINNIPRCALNPHLELKGNVLIRPDIVVLTANSLDGIAQSQVEPGACMRRFPLVVSMPKRDVYTLFKLKVDRSSVSWHRLSSGHNNYSYVIDQDNLSMDQLMAVAKDRYLEHIASQEAYMRSCILPDPPKEVRSSISRVKDLVFRSMYSWAGNNEKLRSTIGTLEFKVSGSEVVAQCSYSPQGGSGKASIPKEIITGLESVSITSENINSSSSDELLAPISINRRDEAQALYVHEMLKSFHERSSFEVEWDEHLLCTVEGFAKYFILQGDWERRDNILVLDHFSLGELVSYTNLLSHRKCLSELFIESKMLDLRDNLNISLLPRLQAREETLTSSVVSFLYSKHPHLRLVAREYHLGSRAGDLLYFDFSSNNFIVIEVKYEKSNGVKTQSSKMSQCVTDALIGAGYSKVNVTGVACSGLSLDSILWTQSYGSVSVYKKFMQHLLA